MSSNNIETYKKTIIDSISEEIFNKKNMVPKLRENVKFTYVLGYEEGLKKAIDIIEGRETDYFKLKQQPQNENE